MDGTGQFLTSRICAVVHVIITNSIDPTSWTCKARRRKCDGTRPSCHACIERGVLCEGYEVRLRWGAGIASRGRFTGADTPVESSIPHRPKGRRRDQSRERRRHQLGAGVEEARALIHSKGANARSTQAMTSLLKMQFFDIWEAEPDPSTAPSSAQILGKVPSKEQLFQECKEALFDGEGNIYCCAQLILKAVLSSGINVLHSTTVHDEGNLLRSRLPGLCQESEALYQICITLQVSMNPNLKPLFYEYFDAALHKFRNELARSETFLKSGTFTAGLLLCTIGVMHGIPWTMHLRGMYSILQLQGVEIPQDQERVFHVHCFEVFGIMDLPTFAIGRQYPYLGFWRRHCRSRKATDKGFGDDDVEIVSGLPRSLVDIFACIGDGGATEQDFWDWPGSSGTFLQYQLWEAYRLAGMLVIRHGQLHLAPLSSDKSAIKSPGRQEQRQLKLPSTAVLVPRILSCADAICRASVEPEGRDVLVINAIAYPVFVAGLQTDLIKKDAKLKNTIFKSLLLFSDGIVWGRQYQLLLSLLEEYWTHDFGTVNIHQLAQAREIELGLF